MVLKKKDSMRKKSDWQPYPFARVPSPWCYWLGIPGSLTKALEEKSGQACVVTIRREAYDYPLPEECEFLSLAVGDTHWVREVTLSQQQRPLVNARSVFPRALIHSFPEFAQLGTQVLGNLLFSNDLGIYRGEIEVAKLPSDVWARRSRFHVREHQIVVCEVFLHAVASL